MKPEEQDFPPRLSEGDGATADLLRKFERQALHAPPESAAWDRTLARLAGHVTGQRLRLGLAATCGALAGAVGFYVLLGPARATRTHGPQATAAAPAVAGEPASAAADRTADRTAGAPAGAVAASRIEAGAGAPAVERTAARAAVAAAKVPRPEPPEALGGPPPAVGVSAEGAPGAPAEGASGEADTSGEGSAVPRIALGHAAVGLPIGRAELVGEARVSLSRGGRARASADEAVASVELAAGEIDLEVEKRADRRRFDVVAGSYRFTALGTAFRVTRSGGEVSLWVWEGRVGVYRGLRLVTVVGGGDRWSSAPAAGAGGGATGVAAAASASRPDAPGASLALVEPSVTAPRSSALEPGPFQPAPPAQLSTPTSPSSSSSSSPTLPAGASPGKDPCGARAARDPWTGVDCYLAEARGTDLRAEIALYEVARLRRDALSDPAGALGALREHRRRFPAGALSTEIELSIAELLPRLRRYREALDQTSALLGAHPRGERAGELYLLRGHVLREGFGDWAGAEQAYAAAAAAAAPGGGARAADPASFWRAVCLEKMGRREEASQAYRRYLARARGAHAGEATRRLEALDRAP